jgi:hypothetical protein
MTRIFLPVGYGHTLDLLSLCKLVVLWLSSGQLLVADLTQFRIYLLTVPSNLTTYLACYVRLQSRY